MHQKFSVFGEIFHNFLDLLLFNKHIFHRIKKNYFRHADNRICSFFVVCFDGNRQTNRSLWLVKCLKRVKWNDMKNNISLFIYILCRVIWYRFPSDGFLNLFLLRFPQLHNNYFATGEKKENISIVPSNFRWNYFAIKIDCDNFSRNWNFVDQLTWKLFPCSFGAWNYFCNCTVASPCIMIAGPIHHYLWNGNLRKHLKMHPDIL